MLIAHAPLAGLLNTRLNKKNIDKLNLNQKLIVIVAAMVAGILPDFDYFIVIAKHQPVFTHHDLITHTPFFWITAYLLGRIALEYLYPLFAPKIRRAISKNFLKIILNAILIGTLSHLFADLLSGSVMLLYPLSFRGFSLLAFWMPVNMFGGFISHPIFYLELAIGALFLPFIFGHAFGVSEVRLRSLSRTVIAFSLTATSLITFVYFQNYNPQYIVLEKGLYKFDQDYDKIADSADWDTDNDGKDNIEDVTSEMTLKMAQKISKEKMFSVNYDEDDRSIVEKIMFQYGSVDSYRLVQMTYILNNSPIPPALLHEINLKETPAYWQNIEEDEELFRFYVKRDMLDRARLSNSLERYQGNVLFMLDGDDEIINMGIVLKDNNILTTFGNGEIVHHSEEVMEQLGDDLESVMVVR